MEFSRFELPAGIVVYTAGVPDRTARHEVGRRLCQAATGCFPLVAGSGRPYVPGGPEVSISHSGTLAACAVGKAPLGVDIERGRTPPPRLTAKAKTIGYDGKTDFLSWWTAREANCKRLGRGFTWSPLPPPEHCAQGTLEHNGETYYYSVCW